jgi:hypothetical protein
MNGRSPVAPVAIAVALGMALWLGASWISGRREAWDAPVYWVIAYPLALLAAAGLGYAYPDRPKLAALALFAAQFAAMCLRNGELGNLWPLGLLAFALLALPAVAAAQFAARMRNPAGAAARR